MTAPCENPAITTRSDAIPCSAAVASSHSPSAAKVGRNVPGSGLPTS